MKNMKNTKNSLAFNLKSFRKSTLMPFTALLLVALMFSSPFLSIARGENEPYSITYSFKMGGTNCATNPKTYTSTSFDIHIADAYDPCYEFAGWAVTYLANFTQVLTPQRDFVIPAGTYGSIELAAIFDTAPLFYYITYVLDGGSNNPFNRHSYFGANDHFPIEISAPYREGYTFAGSTASYADSTPDILEPQLDLRIIDGTTGAITLTAHWNQQKNIEDLVKVTFLPGNEKFHDCTFEERIIYVPLYEKPVPPHPYAKFGYKFVGWQDLETGMTYYAFDYTKPDEVNLPPATKDVTYEAQWALINPLMVFPDKIPSEQHFDRWWNDYGILCFAASSTKDDMYTIMFADWFFDVYRSCIIGFGTPGKISYEIVFEENKISLWQIDGNGVKTELKNKGNDIQYSYKDMTCIRDGHYYTKDKNHNYGTDFGMNGSLKGITLANPFGNGAKQAWLF